MSTSLNQGIILLGCPRSGTTMLRRILDAHENIVCPGETGLFRSSARFIESEVSGSGVEMGVLAGLSGMGVSRAEALSKLRDFTFSFLDDFAFAQNKKRWLEKDAFNSFHIPAIESICEDRVKYICLIRHGMDVAVSLKDFCDKSGSYVLDIHEYIIREKKPLDAFCQLWVDVNRQLLELVRKRPSNALLVKYEELTANPDSEIARILNFLDEPIQPDLIQKSMETVGTLGLGDWKTYSRESVTAGSVGRWSKLNPNEINRMGQIVNSTLEVAGYPLIESEWTEDPALAKRRYELGLLLNHAKKTKQ